MSQTVKLNTKTGKYVVTVIKNLYIDSFYSGYGCYVNTENYDIQVDNDIYKYFNMYNGRNIQHTIRNRLSH